MALPAQMALRFSLTAFAWGLLAVTLTLLLLLSINRYFDHDEFEAMHTTWKMVEGERIYADFIQHHHPFTYYLLRPLYALFGPGTGVLVAARLLSYAQLVTMLALTYAVAWEVYRDRLTAVVSALLLALTTMFTAKALEIRPDVPQSLLSLLGAYLVVRFFHHRAPWLLVASGLSFGVSILFLQKGVVLAGLVGLVLLARWGWGRSVTFGQGLLFAASVVAGVLPYLLYLLLSGTLESFVFWNFTYNTVYYQLRGWELSKLIHNASVLLQKSGPLLLLFGVALLRPKRRLEWELLCLAAGVFAFTLVTGRHNPQYYLLIFPFVSVLAAWVLAVSLGGREVLAALVLLVAFALPAVSYFRLGTRYTSAPQFAKIRYVTSLTSEDDRVYDGNIMFNLFRRDIDFIWYMAAEPYKAAETLATLLDYDYDVYRAIEHYKPKVISTFGIDVNDPRVAEHYEKSPVYEDLYLRVDAQAGLRKGSPQD